MNFHAIQYVNFRASFLLLLLSLLPSANVAGQNAPEEQQDIKLMEALQSPAWSSRYQAARSFPNDLVDTTEGLKLMLSALQSDLDDPLSNEFPPHAYGSKANMLRRQYVFAITRLGPTIRPLLMAVQDSVSAELKQWIWVMLAFLNDTHAKQPLRLLVSNGDSGDFKALAVRALSQYNDTADTMVFMSLLIDPYMVTITEDHDVPGGDFQEDVYPVREEAAGALRMQGFIVTRDENGQFQVRGRE